MPTVRSVNLALVVIGIGASVLLGGCGAALRPLSAEMKPLDLAPQAPAVLQENHFTRDHAGSISEEDLRRVLAAPVFLEENARLGVIQVSTGYEPDADLPLTTVPATLSCALEEAGLFEVASEVSTDWPADRGVSGLRELATRYRAEYLLLYRHRFVDDTTTNAWGWAYLTLLGALFVPAETLQTAGVVEATLFDVKTGTILFTVFARVQSSEDANLWHQDLKRRAMKEKLLEQAAKRLADQVTAKSRRLAASRPKPSVAALSAAPVQ